MNGVNIPGYTLRFLLWMGSLLASAQTTPFHLYSDCDQLNMPPIPCPTQNLGGKDGALRFAHPFFVNLTPENSGRWIDLSDGCRIWTLSIHSQGAKSLNLIFDRFKIDPNSSLILYSPYHEQPLLTFSSADQTPSGVLPTIPIPGDMVVVEYQQYKGCQEAPELLIGAVNHDYLGIFSLLNNNKVGRFGDSGSCNPNITCAEESSIKANSKSVCKIIVDGTELCSGTLVNNTKMDGTPYFLSAAHCFRKQESPFSTIFFFNYEVPACQNTIEGTKMQYITGGTMRAFVDTFDMALLEMNKQPVPQYQPFWAGWNLSETPPAPFHAIHHPQGDVKKYAITRNPLVKTTFKSYTNNGVPFTTDVHWLVQTWHTGTTEGGSSGCGIFDANNRLVGSLSGGEATCNFPQNDYFVRLNRAWEAGALADQQLAFWLNPDNQPLQTLEGTNFYQNTLERLSAIDVKSQPTTLRFPEAGAGFVAGHNTYRHTAFAQYFSNVLNATIKGVYLVSGRTTNYSDQTFSIHIWRDNKGLPGQLIASIDNIPVSTLKYNAESYYEFPTTIEMKEPFHIGAEISYAAQSIDSVALMVSKGKIGLEKNKLSLWDGNQWQPYPEVVLVKEPASLWIDVLASDVIKIDDPQEHIEGRLYLYPQKVTDGFTVASISDDIITNLMVYDMNGKTMLTTTVNGQAAYVPCQNLPSGIYIVKAKLTNGHAERKFVKLPN